MQKQKHFTNKEKTHSIEKDIELTEMMELADNDFKITIAGYMLQDLLMENINIIRKLEIKKKQQQMGGSLLWIYKKLFIQSPVDGYLGAFLSQFLAMI